MVYNYDERKPIPDLKTFRTELIVEMLMSVFFQHRSDKEIDMLHLPPIIAPCLTGNPVNNDISKKTIMEKEFEYEEETLIKFQELINKKEINIKSVGDLKPKDLKDIGTKLGINKSSKSGELLKTDIVNLSQIIC